MTSPLLPAEIARVLVDPLAYADGKRLHEAYTWARANNPLGLAEVSGFDPFWVVTKHADIMRIGANKQLFHNSDRAAVLHDQATLAQIKEVTGGDPNLVRSLVQMDDPEHRKLRAITQSWFMPNNIAKLEARIVELARTEIDRMASMEGEFDFMTAVANNYPLRVIMEILGVPPEDEPRMLMLTQELFGSDDPEVNRGRRAHLSGAERAAALTAAVNDFEAYFKRITDDRRLNPRNDLATVLANATLEGEPLTDRYRTSYYIIVATAGHDTTSSSTGTALWALGQFPHLLPALKADPSLIPAFIEESIRWQTPVRHFMRAATDGTEIRGRQIGRGDWLMLCYGSANRDEEVFEAPFEFRLDRTSNKHLAFGHGGHVCLGMHLARLEMKVFLQELLPRLAHVELAGEIQNTRATFVGGPKHLPVRVKMQR